MDSCPDRSSRPQNAKRKGSDRPETLSPGAGELILLAKVASPPGFDPHEGGTLPGVRDLGAVVAIAAKGEKHVKTMPTANAATVAGLLVHEITTRLPFEDGRNYPAALRVARYTAQMNRWRLDLTNAEWLAFLGDVVRGDLTEEHLATVVASLMRPRVLRAM